MSLEHRDIELESQLQDAIDSGYCVWVVGDIHGHFKTLVELITQLEIKEGHRLISLGDMIDRGPRGAEVLELFRENPCFHAVQGNHEQLMHKSISIGKNRHWKSWLKFGGAETLSSLGVDREEWALLDSQWSAFLSSLPSEIVLDRFRLVHAGYDPDISLEEQKEHDRLWSRGIFQASEALDFERQIIVGHTPVQELDGHSGSFPWKSKMLLRDGRSAIMGIDTGICLKSELNPTLTAFELSSGKVVQIRRID